jgi:four helix bundle protein
VASTQYPVAHLSMKLVMAQHFKDLVVWQKAMDLVVVVYKLSESFPRREVYGLTDQIRRAAVSVPSNIAEGQAHFNRGEFTHFLRHSSGSLAELETQLLLALRLEYLSEAQAQEVLERVHEVGRILSGLIASLKKPAA